MKPLASLQGLPSVSKITALVEQHPWRQMFGVKWSEAVQFSGIAAMMADEIKQNPLWDHSKAPTRWNHVRFVCSDCLRKHAAGIVEVCWLCLHDLKLNMGYKVATLKSPRGREQQWWKEGEKDLTLAPIHLFPPCTHTKPATQMRWRLGNNLSVLHTPLGMLNGQMLKLQLTIH